VGSVIRTNAKKNSTSVESTRLLTEVSPGVQSVPECRDSDFPPADVTPSFALSHSATRSSVSQQRNRAMPVDILSTAAELYEKSHLKMLAAGE